MSNKVYIVLQYWEFSLTTDYCRIRDVYGNKKRAERRKRFLTSVNKIQGSTFHVIEKTLKGSYCLIN